MSETLVHTLLSEQCIPGTNTWSDILKSVNLESLDEAELCKIFGLDPKTLQLSFGDIFKDILKGIGSRSYIIKPCHIKTIPYKLCRFLKKYLDLYHKGILSMI